MASVAVAECAARVAKEARLSGSFLSLHCFLWASFCWLLQHAEYRAAGRRKKLGALALSKP